MHFINSLQEHAAVASFLAVAYDFSGFREFKMQLEISELFLGVDVSAAWFDLHVILMDDPFRRAFVTLPFG